VIEQGTQEWHAERCGCVTASRFSLLMGKPRAKSREWTDAAETYALDLAAERLTGTPQEFGGSAATEWGNAEEPIARAAYEATCDCFVELAPFMRHPFAEWVGGSPDGFAGDNGIIEIKSPYRISNHLATVRAGKVPAEHIAQVQGNLWVTGRDWCDFISWHPALPDSCRLFISRVKRDEDYINQLAERVEAFDAYVHSLVEWFNG
jgi:putative phage-type endonuclease